MTECQEQVAQDDQKGTSTTDNRSIVTKEHIAESTKLRNIRCQMRNIHDPSSSLHRCKRCSRCSKVNCCRRREAVHDDSSTQSSRIEDILTKTTKYKLTKDQCQRSSNDDRIVTCIDLRDQHNDQSSDPSIRMSQTMSNIFLNHLEIDRLCHNSRNNCTNSQHDDTNTIIHTITDTIPNSSKCQYC